MKQIQLPTIMNSEIEDCAQMAEWSRLVGWTIDYRQLGRGKFDGNFSVDLSPGLIVTSQWSNREMVVVGDPPPQMIALVAPMKNQSLGLFRGKNLEPNDVIVGPPGDADVLRTHPDFAVGAFNISASRLEEAVQRGIGVSLAELLPRTRVVRLNPVAVSVLRQAVEAMTSGRAGHGHARQEFEDSLLQAVAEALSTGVVPNVPETTSLKNRSSYVRAAREYIEAHLTGTVRISAVADAVQVTRRTLEFSFRDILGMKPVDYLLMSRLNLSRKLLLESSCKPQRGDVARIAQNSGLSHLGRFSRDYRDLFGEFPSETLKRPASWICGKAE